MGWFFSVVECQYAVWGCNGRIRKERVHFNCWKLRQKNNHRTCMKKPFYTLCAHCQATKNINRTIGFISFRVKVKIKLLQQKEPLAPLSVWWWTCAIKELRLTWHLMIYTVPQLASCLNLIPTGKSHKHRRKKANLSWMLLHFLFLVLCMP